MKPRRVFVTLELETAARLAVLRRTTFWHQQAPGSWARVLQAQANVAKAEKLRARRKA